MQKLAMTEEIMAAKKASGLGWEALAEKVGISPVFLTSACLGMNSLQKDPADKLCKVLSLPMEVASTLQDFPHKSWDKAVPTDPVLYRFYEAMGVYGDSMKAIIHEKFGDGIMSAIDFTMDIDKEEHPQGDRVVITMNGKFLPYKAW